jgi:tRNA A37 N6-isopentenylltransferase MiaA
MILKTQQQTRNYAKRQLTWFRHQFQNLAIVNNLQQAITIVENNWF